MLCKQVCMHIFPIRQVMNANPFPILTLGPHSLEFSRHLEHLRQIYSDYDSNWKVYVKHAKVLLSDLHQIHVYSENRPVIHGVNIIHFNIHLLCIPIITVNKADASVWFIHTKNMQQLLRLTQYTHCCQCKSGTTFVLLFICSDMHSVLGCSECYILCMLVAYLGVEKSNMRAQLKALRSCCLIGK